MDNSSSRIDALLKIASEEDDERNEEIREVKRYYEEQASGLTDEPSQDFFSSTTLDANQGIFCKFKFSTNHKYIWNILYLAEHEKTLEACPVIRKKEKPEFIMEIVADDDEAKKLQSVRSVKKFKLFESAKPPEESQMNTSMSDMSCCSTSESPGVKGQEEEVNVSTLRVDSVKYLCRRVRPRNKQVSAPKRFKLV